VIGERYAEALAASIEWSKGSGAMPVHAFDQAETMMGAGTLGARTVSAGRRSFETVLVAVGGGGADRRHRGVVRVEGRGSSRWNPKGRRPWRKR